MIDYFIIQTGYLFGSVFINIEVDISYMPLVHLLDPLLEHDEVFEKFKNNLKMI